MKKIIFACFILCACSINMFAQKPQVILGIAKENKSVDYYQEQSNLWKKETTKKPNNAFAWWQYYKAQKAYFQLTQPQTWLNNQKEIFRQLNPIVAGAKKNVGNSFEYYLLEAVNNRWDPNSIDYLKKAYQIDPDRKEVHESLLIYYVRNFKKKEAAEVAQKMLENNYYSNASLMWNYNALQTVAPNSVFITNGDMDTIPKWVLQAAKGIRKDVLIISKWSMATLENYRKEMFKKIGMKPYDKKESDFSTAAEYVDHLVAYIMKNSPKPTYTGCGTSKKYFREMNMEENIYLVGTTFVFSKKNFDNFAVTKESFENKYRLEYLLDNFQTHEEDAVVKSHMNLTYLPGLIKMKHHFEKENNTKKANYYNALIEIIAKESGREEQVKSWFKI